MTALLIYPLLTATLFYLGSRAVITQFIWSRYPKKVAKYFDCSACSGTAYGFLVAVIGGNVLHLSFGTLPGDAFETYITVALCSTTWTPFVAERMENALRRLGSAVPDENETENEDEQSASS